jgi:colanic acid biosynthesis glycosyl transferase WcaI
VPRRRPYQVASRLRYIHRRRSMRLLAVNQFYLPDHSATSQLLGELCEDLAADGFEVHVIASRGSYLGGQRLPPRERRNGVHLRRVWATSFGKGSKAQRMADYLSFWGTSVTAAVGAIRPDVILSLTTPPMIALGAAGVAALRRIPLVTWVQDVYPEIAAAFGVISPQSASYRLLSRAAKTTHTLTSQIVGLSVGMAERLVMQGADPARIRVIPNWADGRLIHPISQSENPFRREHGLERRFVAMYSGNLGEGHDVATFVEAARSLRTRFPEMLLLFVGDGTRRREAEARARSLDNVRFLPYQPKERLASSLSAADVHLISLRPGLEGLLVPSKLYGALASGRPICFVGPPDCEVARTVRDNELGWTGQPGDVEGLASALLHYRENSKLFDHRGMRAREIFCTQFDRPIAVKRWRQCLETARLLR